MPTNSPKMTAADVMTPNPRTCSTYSTVLEATMIFRDEDCGAVPVLDDGKPVGILTDRDVALAVIENGDTLTHMAVADVMTQGVISVSPTEELEKVADLFADKSVKRLLVIDDDQLVGIVAWADLVGYISDRRFGEIVSDVVDPT